MGKTNTGPAALFRRLREIATAVGTLGEVGLAPPLPPALEPTLPGHLGDDCMWLSFHRPLGPWAQACRRHFRQVWWLPTADFAALCARVSYAIDAGGAQVLVVDLASLATPSQAWRIWSQWHAYAAHAGIALYLYHGDEGLPAVPGACAPFASAPPPGAAFAGHAAPWDRGQAHLPKPFAVAQKGIEPAKK